MFHHYKQANKQINTTTTKNKQTNKQKTKQKAETSLKIKEEEEKKKRRQYRPFNNVVSQHYIFSPAVCVNNIHLLICTAS